MFPVGGQVNVAIMTMVMMMVVSIRTPLLATKGLELQNLRDECLNVLLFYSWINGGGIVGHFNNIGIRTF